MKIINSFSISQTGGCLAAQEDQQGDMLLKLMCHTRSKAAGEQCISKKKKCMKLASRRDTANSRTMFKQIKAMGNLQILRILVVLINIIIAHFCKHLLLCT